MTRFSAPCPGAASARSAAAAWWRWPATPSNPAVFYFGACAGGVWKTTDGGHVLGERLRRLTSRPRRSARSPSPTSDPNVIYAGMGESTIRRRRLARRRRLSLDRRRQDLAPPAGWPTRATSAASASTRAIPTWCTSPPSATPSARTRSAACSARRTAARPGSTCCSSATAPARSTCRSTPDNPRMLYAAIWEAHPHAVEPRERRARTAASGNRPTAATPGRTCQRQPGLAAAALKGKIGVAVSPARPDRVWAIVEAEDGGLFRSDDGGATWELVSDDREPARAPLVLLPRLRRPARRRTRCTSSTSRPGSPSTAAATLHPAHHAARRQPRPLDRPAPTRAA